MNQNRVFYLLRILFFIIFSIYFISGQPVCSNTDFVLEKNGNVLMTLGPQGGSIPLPVVIGGDVSLLQPNDTLVVNGSIRLIPGGALPKCQYLNNGLLYYSSNGETDSLYLCAPVPNIGSSYGLIWRELALSPVGVSGPAIKDAWGTYWDGFSRNPLTLTAAVSQCNSMGARLPSYTEVTRNPNLFGIPSLGIDNFIWTTTISTSGGVIVVKQSNLATTIPGATQNYRCIWPSAPNNYFAGSNCYGSPGSTCYETFIYNVDSAYRTALTFAQASFECNSKGASLPTFRDLQTILGALNGNYPNLNVNTWVNSGVASLNVPAIYAQTALLTPSPLWNVYTDSGSLGTLGNYSTFICIGRKPQIPIYPQTKAPCTPCFTISPTTKTPLMADNVNRGPLSYYNASALCISLGGELPTLGMVSDLIHQGWYTNSTAPLWTSTPSRIAGSGVNYIAVVGTPIYAFWEPSGSIDADPNAASFFFRCVFITSFTSSSPFTGCSGTQSLNLDETNFQIACIVPTPGNSKGLQNGIANTDPSGNAWDGQARPVQDYQHAQNTCLSVGARLPLMGEVYAYSIIYNQMPGDTSFTDYWTAIYDPINQQAVYINKQGSASTTSMSSQNINVRCIWPPVPFGNIFGGHKCLGGCFVSNNMVIDSYDRPETTIYLAAQECQFLGGRLPTFSEMYNLIQSGAPNGYWPCTQLNSATTPACERLNGVWVTSSGGTSGTNWAIRWLGTQPGWTPIYNPSSWSTTSTILDFGTLSATNTFRCVYSTNLD